MLPCGAGDLDFDGAAKYSRATGGGTLLIWQKGQTRSDSTRGSSPTTPAEIFSITKSLTALAWLARFSPETKVPVSLKSQESLRAATLLSQTSGISPGAGVIYRRKAKDVYSSALRLPRIAAPGTAFAYGPAHYEILGGALERTTNGQNAVTAILLRRLGITPPAWRSDGRGRPFYSAGAFLTANDLLRIGRLILDHGRTGMFSPVIPADHLATAFRGTEANPAYGLGFWLNARASKPGSQERDIEQALSLNLSTAGWQHTCLSKAAPDDLVCMAGSNGQRVYISRSKNLVVVRTGGSRRFRDPDFLRILFRGSPPSRAR